MQRISLALLSRPKRIDCGRVHNAGNLLYQWPSGVSQAVYESQDFALAPQNAARTEHHVFVSSHFNTIQRSSAGETLSAARAEP